MDNIEELKFQLAHKEQECEKAKQNAQDTYELYQALMESFNILQGEKIKLEQECEELKKELEAVYNDCKGCPTCNEALYNANLYAKKYRKLKQTLIEIKPILDFYANSNMGEEQPDRTYKILSNGSYIIIYDPKPARQALQKINEVENEG